MNDNKTLDALRAMVKEQKEAGLQGKDITEVLLMSVPERMRTLSSLNFYSNAVDIRAKILQLGQSAAIPKSMRGAFSKPLNETARSMVHNINIGSACPPTNAEKCERRKYYYTRANDDNLQLLEDLQTLAAHQLVYGISKVNLTTLCDIANMCTEEQKLLAGAIKNTKIKSNN